MSTPAFEPAKRHGQLVWSKRHGCMVIHNGPYKPVRDKRWETPQGAGREKVRREGKCRVGKEAHPDCMVTWALHRHHLVGKDRNGDDVDENLIPLCHACHDAFHSSIFAPAIAAAIRASMLDVELRFVLEHPEGGAEWLDKTYPLRQQAA